MADNKKPNEKQPGEKNEGKYHYNPGNQSGKEAEIVPKRRSEKGRLNETEAASVGGLFDFISPMGGSDEWRDPTNSRPVRPALDGGNETKQIAVTKFRFF